MTTAKEKCVLFLDGITKLIQSCENPESKQKLMQARSSFHQAMSGATEEEAEIIVRMIQDFAEEGDRND